MLRKIAINTIISFIARTVGVILSFFSLALVTRFLGTSKFGLYSTALTIAYIISFIADFGLYTLTVRELGRSSTREEEERVFSHLFTIRLVGFILFFAIGLGVVFFLGLEFEVSKSALIISALFYILMGFNQLFVGVFQKHLALKGPSIHENIGRIIILGALAYLFFLHPLYADYRAVLIVYTAGTAYFFLINFLQVRKIVSFRLSIDWNYWKHLLRQAFPMALIAIFTALYFKMDTLYIAHFRGQNEVGLYNAAYKLLETLIFFPSLFVGVLMPELSRLALVDREQFKRMFQGAFDVILIGVIPLVILLYTQAEPIMRLIAGKSFEGSADALGILAFGTGIIFFGALFSNALLALNLQKQLAFIYGIGASFNIIANFLIVPHWGYIGAGVTTLFTEALVTFFMVSQLEGILFMRLTFKRIIPIFFSSAALIFFLLFFHFPFVLQAFGGIIVYVSCLFATGGVRKKEVLALLQS